MDFALSQLISDTANPTSVIRGHSLLRDMYGNDAAANGAPDDALARRLRADPPLHISSTPRASHRHTGCEPVTIRPPTSRSTARPSTARLLPTGSSATRMSRAAYLVGRTLGVTYVDQTFEDVVYDARHRRLPPADPTRQPRPGDRPAQPADASRRSTTAPVSAATDNSVGVHARPRRPLPTAVRPGRRPPCGADGRSSDAFNPAPASPARRVRQLPLQRP